MKIIGTDEAGYGPNLGPLLVTASLWETEDVEFSAFVEACRQAGFPLGDSKKIYHGGDSLALLEKSVLGLLKSLDIEPKSDFELFQDTKINSVDPTIYFNSLAEAFPKTVDAPIALPVLAKDISTQSDLFRQICSKTGVRLLGLAFRCVFPDEFNRLLERYDSKGTLLSELTLQLVVKLLQDNKDDCLILCDKHGGRNRYLDLLNRFFPDEMIWVDRESREKSIYRLPREEYSLEFRFIAKGESQIPIAFSSMVSKYFRELSMIRFNAFWQSHLPGLRATAGYPEDARRFKRDIANIQNKLGITDDLIWRKK